MGAGIDEGGKLSIAILAFTAVALGRSAVVPYGQIEAAYFYLYGRDIGERRCRAQWDPCSEIRIIVGSWRILFYYLFLGALVGVGGINLHVLRRLG